MSYIIQYSNKGIIKKSKIFPINFSTICYAVAVPLLCFLIYKYRLEIIECFIPGNNEVTLTAMDNLICNLKEGTELSDSITVFCREILDNAQLPQ